MKYYIHTIILSGFLLSCTPSNGILEESLKESGKNRPELEQVLAHYANDSLKLQAAHFLISNMPGHHSWDSPQLSAYRNKMDSIYPEASSVTKRVVYSIPWHNDFSMEARQRVEDIQVIKGDLFSHQAHRQCHSHVENMSMVERTAI